MKLNKTQSEELKFFCKSVMGTRQEFYKLYDQMNDFKNKLDRMEKFVKNVEEFLGKIEPEDLSSLKWDNK